MENKVKYEINKSWICIKPFKYTKCTYHELGYGSYGLDRAVPETICESVYVEFGEIIDYGDIQDIKENEWLIGDFYDDNNNGDFHKYMKECELDKESFWNRGTTSFKDKYGRDI